LRARAGGAVVDALHDVNLAARFCDHLLLLFGDGEVISGAARDVLSPAQLSRLYGLCVSELAFTGCRYL
ncbi:MAG: ABC transporter ATP-binding protein, partial [Anaerolineales bacterium]